ncbi:MAG TPA: nucleotidyltransferase domain-containing protein [bacterium]|nr:nucleotidyltransferase domain-containing protein [bacterium]HPP29373.1 nucleotidyltransferase domain-containing protein [bacterium]
MKGQVEGKIKQISESLKDYNPEKVILFGSYAWGTPGEDSDFDLLIIKRTNQKFFKRVPEARKYLYKINSAFDILVLTPEEIEKRRKMGDFFIKEILEKGKVLYERKKQLKTG